MTVSPPSRRFDPGPCYSLSVFLLSGLGVDMSWVQLALSRLALGESVRVRPSGHSMTGLIGHRNAVDLAPIEPDELEVGDAVLVRVAGQVYLHKIVSIDTSKRRVLIGNNRGKINGWASFGKVFGVAIRVEGRPTAAMKRASVAQASATDEHD